MTSLLPFIILFGLIASLGVMLLVELLVPKRYLNTARMIIIPCVFLASIGVGFVSFILEGLIAFFSSAPLFFSNHLNTGFGWIVEVLDELVGRRQTAPSKNQNKKEDV